ncbi:MAG: hypothetical protein QNJ64_02300 [Crocosphaera sp.]|nr:hypothetical protein [Crocosphaera sp.]
MNSPKRIIRLGEDYLARLAFNGLGTLLELKRVTLEKYDSNQAIA